MRQCNVVGFNVNELAPMPGNVAPDFLTAKLVYRIMGYIVEARQRKGGGAKIKRSEVLA